jgi:hypothetical protein
MKTRMMVCLSMVALVSACGNSSPTVEVIEVTPDSGGSSSPDAANVGADSSGGGGMDSSSTSPETGGPDTDSGIPSGSDSGADSGHDAGGQPPTCTPVNGGCDPNNPNNLPCCTGSYCNVQFNTCESSGMLGDAG